MHILFIADASSPHSYRWIKYFAELDGIRVTWCTFTENSMPIIEGVDYKKLNKNNPLELLRSLAYVSKKTADIIHVHYIGWNGLISLFFPKIPTVLTAWGSDIVFNSKNWLMRFFIKKIIKRAKVITCDAYHLKDRMIELGTERSKVNIIMFGIDEDLFISKRKPFDIDNSNNKYIVGSIRNLHPVYDVITLLKAAKNVLNHRKDVIFNIAGSGPDLQSLEDYVKENSLEEGVKFLGRLEPSQLLNFYNELDIYVSTSLSDGGIASSTAEAMLCERPAIITDAAENRYWIQDHKNGRLFDCSDVSSLTKIILQMLENHEDAINLGLKGKEMIIKNNSYKNEMNKMFGIYKTLHEEKK